MRIAGPALSKRGSTMCAWWPRGWVGGQRRLTITAPWRIAMGCASLPMLLGSHYPLDLVIIMLGANDLKPHICGYAAGAAAGIDRCVEIARSYPYGYGTAAPQVLVVSPPHFSRTDLPYQQPAGGRSIAESEKAGAALSGCGTAARGGVFRRGYGGKGVADRWGASGRRQYAGDRDGAGRRGGGDFRGKIRVFGDFGGIKARWHN